MDNRLLKVVLVEVWNPKSKTSTWEKGTLISKQSSVNPNEDFDRFDVELDDGRRFYGCHPNCIKE